LGRPTAVKAGDLEIMSLSSCFARLGDHDANHQKPIERLIYDSLSELMEIAGHVADRNARKPSDLDNSAYVDMSFLDGEMSRWYRNLPGPLKWKTTNIKNAPQSLFLMQ
jgi:hypothetical protein